MPTEIISRSQLRKEIRHHLNDLEMTAKSFKLDVGALYVDDDVDWISLEEKIREVTAVIFELYHALPEVGRSQK